MLPPLQTPSSVRGKRPGGTEPEKEGDAGTEDGEGDPALRVRSRDEEGRKDRLTHGLTVSKSGSSQSRAQESQNPALSYQAERQTVRQTDVQKDRLADRRRGHVDSPQPASREGGGGAP